jgi:hypothetical protein
MIPKAVEPVQSCLGTRSDDLRTPASELAGYSQGSLGDPRPVNTRPADAPLCRALLGGQPMAAVPTGDDAYFPIHWSTQSLTVLYQSWEFWGFRTQWPSSGK